MQAPKPQISTFANEGVSPLRSGPDVGRSGLAGPPICASAIRRRSNRQRCRASWGSRSIVEARQHLKETRTRLAQTVGTVEERRADALTSQASASIRTAAVPRSLVASHRRQGGARISPVCFPLSLESSFHPHIPLHARNHCRRG